jgi:hypothetical protein
MRRLVPLLLLALALPARAEVSGPALTLDDLVDRADEIVVAEVVAAEGRWEGRLVVTDTTVRVQESLKGDAPEAIRLTQPGGTAVHPRLGVRVTTVASGVATLRPGEALVLFVRTRNGRRHLVGGAQGKLVLADEPPAATAAPAPRRSIAVGPKRLAPDGAGNIAVRGMTLDELRARIRAQGGPRARRGVRAEDGAP